MKHNLKEYVQKFVEKRAKLQFPHLYIVDKITGPYRTIQDAINAASPNSLIKISQGFYEENLIINKPLTIEPKNLNENTDQIGVVLLASAGIAIHIKLPEHEHQCQITGMKISHSGNSDFNLKKQLLEHEHILNIFESHEGKQELESEYINQMTFNKIENMIVLIERGKVRIEHCILSLNYLVKSCNSVIPAVWIEKDGILQMHGCEIKGHQIKPTIGIVCKLGVLDLQNSLINNHQEGAVLIWGIQDNPSKIIKNLFQKNSIAVHLVGQQFKLKIIDNKIINNSICGIKVGLASQPDISRNIILENGNGIEINSAFPNIYLNKIQKNNEDGIICRTYKKFICQAQIKKNVSIVGNKKNGIVIEGENNRTIISHNYLIAFNLQSGIRIEKQSFPSVTSNKIYKNYKEGVLIVENTNAILQKNEITHNIQCNIAMGGINSHHSLISQNLISYSPGIGIHLINAGRCKMVRNDINNNHDGIVMSQSQSELRKNYISDNLNNGIVIEKYSSPIFIDNFITRNKAVGVFVRSHVKNVEKFLIHSNIVVSNQINVALERKNEELLRVLALANTIQTEIYYPEGLECQLI